MCSCSLHVCKHVNTLRHMNRCHTLAKPTACCRVRDMLSLVGIATWFSQGHTHMWCWRMYTQIVTRNEVWSTLACTRSNINKVAFSGSLRIYSAVCRTHIYSRKSITTKKFYRLILDMHLNISGHRTETRDWCVRVCVSASPTTKFQTDCLTFHHWPSSSWPPPC